MRLHNEPKIDMSIDARNGRAMSYTLRQKAKRRIERRAMTEKAMHRIILGAVIVLSISLPLVLATKAFPNVSHSVSEARQAATLRAEGW